LKRIAFRVAVALLTFSLGIMSAYLAWLAYSNPDSIAPQTLQTEVATPSLLLTNDKPSQENVPRRNVSLEDGWARLTATEFCFFGSNMYSQRSEADPSAFSETGGPFVPDGWMPSLKDDEPAGVRFIIKQIPDTSQTKAHVDPFGMALKGEMAVYCLQQIMKLNWYELKQAYKIRLARAVARDPGQSQAVLQRIIKSKKEAHEMMALWADYYRNRRPQDNAGRVR
jgi:hypothetical protein